MTDCTASNLANAPAHIRGFWRAQIRSARVRRMSDYPPGYVPAPEDPALPAELARLVIVIEGPRGEYLPGEGKIAPHETQDTAVSREACEASRQAHDALDVDTRDAHGPDYWQGWTVSVFDGADCVLTDRMPEVLYQIAQAMEQAGLYPSLTPACHSLNID